MYRRKNEKYLYVLRLVSISLPIGLRRKERGHNAQVVNGDELAVNCSFQNYPARMRSCLCSLDKKRKKISFLKYTLLSSLLKFFYSCVKTCRMLYSIARTAHFPLIPVQLPKSEGLCRLHTAFLHWPLSSAATKEVQGPDTT